ncbi:MAG: hypothetical protein Q4B04_02290 [bacterium]|nr:hypothetical protein [bacterium]
MTKKDTKTFFRTFFLTSTLLLCPVLLFWGFCRAYEGIRLIGFCQYTTAINYLADGTVDVLGINIDPENFGFLVEIKNYAVNFCPHFFKIIGQCINALTKWLGYFTEFVQSAI